MSPRSRISDAEAAARSLAAGAELVRERGLAIGLEHIGLEEVIGRAGVSRTAVYRRWGGRQPFLDDLLQYLAQGTDLINTEYDATMSASVQALIADHAKTLSRPDGARIVVTELIRQTGLIDWNVLEQSSQWRIFIALSGAVSGIVDPDVRASITQSLATAEQRLSDHIAHAYKRLLGLLRIRFASSEFTIEDLTTMATAEVRGLLMRSQIDPAVVRRRIGGFDHPALTGVWPLDVLSMATMFLAVTQPAPAMSEAQIDELLQRLAESASIFA